jgi:lysozyme
MRLITKIVVVCSTIPLLAVCVLSQSGEFNQPWIDAKIALVLDPYEGNSMDFDELATETRVVAIIHRATHGNVKDNKYSERKTEALKRGYKWGSYHLGKPGDPVKQADFYLKTVNPGPEETMALDIETLDPSQSMTLTNARQFIERVKVKTGRFPMIYGNQDVIRNISQHFGKDDVFSNVALWYARFKDKVTDFPLGTFKMYTLWQFKSEINCTPKAPQDCPILIPGTKTDMDVNVFNGTIEDLKSAWPLGTVK